MKNIGSFQVGGLLLVRTSDTEDYTCIMREHPYWIPAAKWDDWVRLARMITRSDDEMRSERIMGAGNDKPT